MRPLYKDMTRGEQLACGLAFAVSVACLVVVATTPLSRGHSAAVVTGPAMVLVVAIVAGRIRRRQD